MEEFLNYVIKQLVDEPDEVIITRTELPDHIQFNVAMRKSDLGRIIGRGGHTIQALRTLLTASAERQGLKVALKIIE